MKVGRARAGFSAIELVIAITVLGLIVVNVSMVMRAGSSAYEAGVFSSMLHDQGEQTLDRIAQALMPSTLEDLNPELAAGMHTPEIEYVVSLGVEDGALVLSDPERIRFVGQAGEIVWSQEGADQRQVVWGRYVSPNFEGELPNGIDDNGNGLLDEEGLCFETEGRLVRVRLTLERQTPDGATFTWSRERVVACRN